MTQEIIKIKITTNYITLNQFLKFSGIITNGGDIKNFLKLNKIIINGTDENRRGRKIFPNDFLVINEKKYLII